MKKFKPDRHAMLTLRILTAVIALLLLGISQLYFPVHIITIIIAAAIITALIFVDFIYLPLYFSSLSYESDGESITRHGGVVFKSHMTVKYSTVQYTAVITTPFSKHTGLNFAVLFVYGGQLRLDFLNYNDCEEILRLAGKSRKEKA